MSKIFVYRPGGSDGADALVEQLSNARRARVYVDVPAPAFRRRATTDAIPVRAEDVVVCWGAALAREMVPATILNGAASTSKYEQARQLAAAGVATVEVRSTPPPPAGPQVFDLAGGALNPAEVRDVMARMQAWLDTPREIWVGRRNNHVGGADLLHPTLHVDYWSKREQLVREYRLHIVKGKSIRAGVKIPREGVEPHAWVRSFDGGWRINYTGFTSTKPMRALAAAAVEALELDFGAVDLGEREDGSLLVLEVNRAPGLEGGTIEAYASAFDALRAAQGA